jgi:hypothetical protein
MKYRIVKRCTGEPNWPEKYLAQRKGVFGWKMINSGTWSYNYNSAKDYIHSDIEKRHYMQAVVPPDEIIEEIEA